MSHDAIKLKPPGTTYGVIHRLGLKYTPPAVARPSFTAEAQLAKEFWDEMFIVFDNFRRMAIDEPSARRKIYNLVEQYGPRIWGADRSNVVSYPYYDYPEYTRDLYWDEGVEVQQLYESSFTFYALPYSRNRPDFSAPVNILINIGVSNQALALFEDRLKKRDLNARKPGNTTGNSPKRKYPTYLLPQRDHVDLAANDVTSSDDTSEYGELTDESDFGDDVQIPYALRVPRNAPIGGRTSLRRKRKRRSPYSLIVRLGYNGCDRPNRDDVPCNRVECEHTERNALAETTALESSANLPPRQGSHEQVSQQMSEREPRPIEQYRKQGPVPSFAAINHPKQPAVLTPSKQAVWLPEGRVRTASPPLGSDPTGNSNQPAGSYYPGKDASAVPPNSKNTPQQTHEQSLTKGDISHDWSNAAQQGKTWEFGPEDAWAMGRLASTILHVRAGDAWDNIITMDLGLYRDVNMFFIRVSRQLGCIVTHLSILVPSNVAQLSNYVIQIKHGDQKAYTDMVGTLLDAIERDGVKRPVKYVLAGTATCQ
ncbi:hypothetical protein FKW77_010792 [Venturia effusa]|uniref:Uncharacterized protein n=1 Tax=Venturia effusa TaxID=50376 RepID=A0A517KYG1_9PEZI|nr:hypothetical protein FKW77_010792 [Venturia effusa]